MTSDPYNHPLGPAPRPRRRNGLGVLLIILAALAAVCGVIGCIGVIADDRAKDDGLTRPATKVIPAPFSPPAAPTAPAAKTWALAPADVKLGVKITSKQCFGSAGCNVTFKVTVDVPPARLADRDWTVTYEVRGVDGGPQVAELSLHPDGTFEQDSFQFGQTPSRGTKLSAKATDVEPVL